MKKKLITLLIIALPVGLSISLTSCKKTFDIEPKSAIAADQMYRNVFDADGAVVGIYGKFLNLMDRYVILNELRSDLADVTVNSNQYLKQLSTHTVTVDNPYADPRPFYEVILNCNDALKNFKIMVDQHKMTVDQYNQRYSDIGALRCWLYLQVGIQYGNIPYVTEPIVNINDLSDATKYPRIGLKDLIDQLVTFAESLPNRMPYSSGSTLLTTVDTYNTAKMFIDKNCLLGDLYLWQGSWRKAAAAYMEAVRVGQIPYNTNPASEQTFDYYKMGYDYLNGGDWAKIFNQAYGERYSNYEIIWDLPYDKNFSPKNPFLDMFSALGSYVIKPSNLAMNNWNGQFRNDNGSLNGTPGDARGNGVSFKMMGTAPQINKYFLSSYSPFNPFETAGKMILYRASTLYLRYAEAANHDGRNQLAMAFVNGGVKGTYRLSGMDKSWDVTNYEQSRDQATGALEVAPYYFDAREGDAPYFRQPWYRSMGVRSRAGVMDVKIDSTRSYNLSATPRVIISQANLNDDIDDNIIAESALETAYEGNRWGDLIRIAMRRQTTDPNYLAKKIGAKFDAANDPANASAVRARLADPANWFLPFRWK